MVSAIGIDIDGKVSYNNADIYDKNSYVYCNSDP